MGISRVFRIIPPFKNIYKRLDMLEEEKLQLEMAYDKINKSNEKLLEIIEEKEKSLKKADAELKKKYDFIFSVEQKYEKNMNSCYENLKKEVRDNKKVMDSRHEYVFSTEQNYEKTMNELYNELKKEVRSLDGELHKDVNTLDGKTNSIIAKIQSLEKEARYNYYKGLHPDQYPEALKEWYKERTGEELNLDNPQTFNEKVQWMKLYDNTEFKSRLTDKYLVRDYITDKIGKEYLVPLLGVYDSFDEIDFDKLPEKFAMKTNHSSGWNIIVTDKNQLDKALAKNKFDYWLKRIYAFEYGLELHYKNIKPKIIIEEFIENFNDEVIDYRFFCFDGKAYSIWIDVDSGKPSHRRNIYDLEWNLQQLTVNYPNDDKLDKRPKNLKKMIELAEELSKGIKMVRVDLYEIEDKIYFGEMTFTPQSGQATWNPPEYNKIYGDQIKLPNKND